ncbi:AcrR family transcriptional regulator [Clostridium saccharoperbutylacetonicum]|uniref:Transcriptional regulator, TetR family n=1 Tax=Clostridium saccharoperbutylacetonicum N1-4(HMT) TaxID=931276 RepID=M1MRR1_9CLOT|nr:MULTISPECIES: TetR/AcrR family transcriptional regulator [Clostridium]AGF58838.1 transcriptional regulator, TetR family [Clostridium saccharoperbutylacetonicum N1-4(HMT)]AQR97519.1 HTH-type transcriptional repressor Bm3R1 [Clostridium saccharoperbutylacetonicum]NRT60378.1 AcrR family transcriptional regulator [Clostridium saccharoperbutylacetonicum]NSB23691.1 AcrR family transcriptional regulator [Clostridium saccharoperbutylacetonicum]NSB33403.1 AcrR family transcriptional regulator [Clost
MTEKKSLKELINLCNPENSMTERQLNILVSAIELFSEKGYEATSTSEIAKNAKVAEGTIFRYYKTKKDLLFAIPYALSNNSLFEVFLNDFKEILDDDPADFEIFLKKLILNRQKFICETAPIIKVVIQEVPFHPELRQKILNTVILPSVKRIKIIIDKFKAQGKLIDIPSNSIANLIATSVFGYLFLHYIALPELPNCEEDIDYLVHYIMNGISKTSTTTN